MPIERVFLGWDGPCLPRAARWLAETFGSSDGPPDGSLADVFPEVDLSRVILVTPGRRSGRRLLELLVEAADDRLLSPPQHATPGDLFDLLCPPELSPTPSARPADELRCLLARVASLRAADDATLRLIVPVPPPAGDLRPWLSLANDLHRLHDALAAEAVTHRDVLKRCGGAFEFDDSERWEALAALQADYQSALARQGLVDPQAARIDLLRALEAGSASVASRLDAGVAI
ncbi:MAG: hypothetical protein NTW19_20740 [Planctomycetota bacterium]|nr:hypothetical protein [Planctomycetota bacterium]